MRLSVMFTGGPVVLTAAVLALGCGPAPTAPASASPSVLANLTAPGAGIDARTVGLTPADLTARRWTCRVPPPYPDRIVCMAPNQQMPSPAVPVDERPPTFTMLVFQNTGELIGTVLGIRADLYQGQICGPTKEPYIFRPPIGYYECLHPAGR